jgi:hypothetical protein
MSKRMLLSVGVLVGCGIVATGQAQQFIYKWNDEQGQIKYSELPPPSGVSYETVRKPAGFGKEGDQARDLAKEQEDLAKKLAEEEAKTQQQQQEQARKEGDVKETPSDAEVISHQLMLRAGMIRKLASGIYAWLPTGLRVLKQGWKTLSRRDEQCRCHRSLHAGGTTRRAVGGVRPLGDYGPELCRLTDRHNRPFVLGPTHEEVITNLVRYEVNSYKQLPLNLYQIQTKFRDEVRPRFGVMRGREFLMKDAYSFHIDKRAWSTPTSKMHAAYCAPSPAWV